MDDRVSQVVALASMTSMSKTAKQEGTPFFYAQPYSLPQTE
jgi:hypothetical protein